VLAIIFLSCISALRVYAQEKSRRLESKYNGSGSCSASGCHGGAQITDIDTRKTTATHVWQNESFIWTTQDPHFKAFSTLQTTRSKKIWQILKESARQSGNQSKYNASLPENEPQCLGCHALKPEHDLQARLVFPEGVSCESCHSASSLWFESHFQRQKNQKNTDRCLNTTNTEASIRCGLYPMRDAVKRSERCLECHVGTEKYEVDHELIAAGHPDLLFELDIFSARMPRHWATPNELHEVCDNMPKDSNYEARLWAVGQAVQLREVLKRLARRAERAQVAYEKNRKEPLKWPELSELDCFSCHHSVYSNAVDPGYDRYAPNSHPKGFDSWRQTRGYENRAAGSPPWNSAHYSIFRILLKAIDRDDRDENTLENQWPDLLQVASRLNSSPENIAEVAQKSREAANLAANLVEKVASRFKPAPEADKPLLRKIMLQISAGAVDIANKDTRTAEQAYMALDSLFRSYAGIKTGEPLDNSKDAPHKLVGRKIEALYQLFDNPSAYDGRRFTEAMQQVHDALMNTSEVALKKPSQSRIARKLQIRQPHSAN
jgi:hypothetical protein